MQVLHASVCDKEYKVVELKEGHIVGRLILVGQLAWPGGQNPWVSSVSRKVISVTACSRKLLDVIAKDFFTLRRVVIKHPY